MKKDKCDNNLNVIKNNCTSHGLTLMENDFLAQTAHSYMFHITLYISFSVMQDFCIIQIRLANNKPITLYKQQHHMKAQFQPHLSK